MESVVWNGIEMTTMSEIANHYSEGNKIVEKEIKPFIRTGVNKLKNSVKLSRDEIQNNSEILKPITPTLVPHTGMILVPVSEIRGLERYFVQVLKRKMSGEYKKDRFFSRRSLIDELKLELRRNEKSFDTEEFKAVLSYISRLEIGQPKSNALRDASKNFGVTQAQITRIFEDLELQIDYVNKPKNYV